jgi:hypothetical protein
LTQETKPKIKKSIPMIRMEMTVSRLVRELTSTGASPRGAVNVLLMNSFYEVSF